MWDENSDFALAMQLQNELNTEISTNPTADVSPNVWSDNSHNGTVINGTGSTAKSYNDNTEKKKPMSLVDPQWELIDPNPDVRMLFLEFNERFFWGKLSCVEVRWSPRMTLCAGVCSYEGRGSLCSVRLSTPLLKLRPRKDLIETLLHEMIHAYLFVTDNNKDHDGHGPEFHKHMYRLNGETGTNISVYHNFHDEVDSLRQHWWRCDGSCRSKPPYFGYVKRSMNRAPSSTDTWWSAHQQTCGGSYTKVKEPEGYVDKKKKKEEREAEKKQKGNDRKDPGTDIRKMFNNDSSSAKPDSGLKSVHNKNNIPTTEKPKANIAGFKRVDASGSLSVYKDEDDSSQNTPLPTLNTNPGVNIAGFKRDNPSAGLDVYKGFNSSKVDLFSGTGKTLGGSCSNSSETSSNHIIRRIPGIGIIESCRKPLTPNGNVDTKTCLEQCISDDEDDDLLIFSPKEKKQEEFKNEKVNIQNSHPTKSGVESWLERGKPVCDKKESSLINDSDSDNDFDRILNKFATNQTKRKSKTKSKKSSSSTPTIDKFVWNHKSDVGSVISLPGFKSVSGSKSTPPVKKLYPLNSDESGSNMSPTSNKTVIQEDVNFSKDRNKRAHGLVGINSDSDDGDNDINNLEKQSLASIVNRKKRRTQSPTTEKHSFVRNDSGNIDSVGSSRVNNNENNYHSVPSSSAISDTGSNVFVKQSEQEKTVPCPVCGNQVEETKINQHLDTCLSLGML